MDTIGFIGGGNMAEVERDLPVLIHPLSGETVNPLGLPFGNGPYRVPVAAISARRRTNSIFRSSGIVQAAEKRWQASAKPPT